ncbi:uncharacterized protein LOC110931963 [Helianthus annuus]|uniref:uncharacterized protein LOC110931963 n=1 Tax=Helianthus annuus TaxID=4232 RepID=UPI000B9083F1|nr:uncharacterized protein LOC110931963 [Helianthus annuus]
MGTLQTCKAYIDTGAGTEIMFEKFFKRLSNEERSRLQPSRTSIKGIADIPLKPLGQLTLDVRFSEGLKERTQSLTFVVINIPSSYDVIIGRPGQCAFYMAVSVGHGTVKFPTERGIATLQPSQEAYMIEGENSNNEEDRQSKWPEVKPLAKITGKQVIDFVWENIICRYGLPGVIVTDNGKQFAEKPFSLWCKECRINQIFSSVAYPQSNSQVERANRSIVEGIKTRLG